MENNHSTIIDRKFWSFTYLWFSVSTLICFGSHYTLQFNHRFSNKKSKNNQVLHFKKGPLDFQKVRVIVKYFILYTSHQNCLWIFVQSICHSCKWIILKKNFQGVNFVIILLVFTWQRETTDKWKRTFGHRKINTPVLSCRCLFEGNLRMEHFTVWETWE